MSRTLFVLKLAALPIWNEGLTKGVCSLVLSEVEQGEACAGRRGVGPLMGGRTAGALRRIPVLDMFGQRHGLWRGRGFRAEGSGASEARLLCAAVDSLSGQRRGSR